MPLLDAALESDSENEGHTAVTVKNEFQNSMQISDEGGAEGQPSTYDCNMRLNDFIKEQLELNKRAFQRFHVKNVV